MTEFLTPVEPWYWLILGFIFLGLEAIGTGGFLLGSALAALLVALILWLAPALNWSWQLVIFGLSSLIFTLAYWKLFRSVNNKTDHQQLNNRAAQLIDRVVDISEPIAHGQGRIQIGDTLWKVKVDKTETIEAGAKVIVIGAQGMTLLIKRYS